jgi:coenzyme F420-dependent glucose-6-phosphate dehydrogenase
VPLRLGYKASAEQFAARPLLDYSLRAEQLGFDSVAISDHFQPWRHTNGHAPFAMTWLGAFGERSQRVAIGTSVLTPTFRYSPAVVAQAFATLGTLFPGRVFLGVGTGEAMNESGPLGLEWPKFTERLARLVEAVRLIRNLWAGERVTFEGEYYRTVRATVYERPQEKIPILIAASSPKTARVAGELADGFICTSGKDPDLYGKLLGAVAEGARGAGRDPGEIEKMIEVKVSYDTDAAYAREACRWWAALALSAEEKSGVDDPIELERLADANADRAATRFIVSSDPSEVAQGIETYVRLGFDHLVFHAPGNDQERFLTQFSRDVLPLVRA